MILKQYFSFQPANWSSGNALVSGAGGLRFNSRTGQIGHSVTNGSPPLRHSSKGAVLPGRNDAEMGPAHSLHASAYYSEYNDRFDLSFRFKLISLKQKNNNFETLFFVSS